MKTNSMSFFAARLQPSEAAYSAALTFMGWLGEWVSVTFVYCVETDKEQLQLPWNGNRKPYRSFRMVITVP